MATVASGLNSGSGFGNSDTVTSTTLNNHVNDATVTNIQTADIASSTSKTSGVTFEKMQHISTGKVLGRTTALEGDVEEVSLLDENDMNSDSDTAVATQQSIKAYVDTYALQSSSSSAFSFDTTNSFADLDISSVVGTNKAFVFALVVKTSGGGTGATNINFKTKGDTVASMDTTNLYGAGSGGLAVGDASVANVGGYISVITDSSGVIQHRSNDASQTGFTFQVKAFQILR